MKAALGYFLIFVSVFSWHAGDQSVQSYICALALAGGISLAISGSIENFKKEVSES